MDVLIGWPGGDWQGTARLAGTLVGGYLGLIWLASVLWVYRDITARTRDPISQLVALAVAVALPLIGLPIYLALRPSETLNEVYERQIEQEAILSEMHSVTGCPSCRRPVENEFMVCAYCGTNLKRPCAHCGELMRHAWRYCPHCATPREQPRSAARLDFGAGDEGYGDDDDLDEFELRPQPIAGRRPSTPPAADDLEERGTPPTRSAAGTREEPLRDNGGVPRTRTPQRSRPAAPAVDD